MARIKFTALVESIRGSIAGTTFQRNAYGFTVKSKPNMVNPNTSSQSRRKTAWQQAQQLWRTLTAGERANWDTYAATFPVPTHNNPAAYLSGFNLFVRWHAITFLAYTDELADPSAAQANAAMTEFDLGFSGGIFSASYEIPALTGDWHIFIFLSRPLIPTQLFNRSFTRFVISNPAEVAQSYNLNNAYNSLFGQLPQVGDSIACEVTLRNDGNAQVIYVPSFIKVVTA